MQHYASLAGVELALSDLRPALLTAVADRFGVQRRFSDHRELLAWGVDAVVIIVRRPATGPIVRDALAAGVAVLSEKPMAMTAAAAASLVASAKDPARYGVAYMKRFDRGVNALQRRFDECLADGRLGRLRAIDGWSFGGDDGSAVDDFAMTAEARPDGLALWPTAPEWLPRVYAAAYEETLNVHSHITNVLRRLAGAWEVTAAARCGDEIRVTGQIASSPAAIALHLGSSSPTRRWREGLDIRFERGALHLDFAAPFAADGVAAVTEIVGEAIAPIPLEPGTGAFARQAAAFVAMVRGQAPFESPASEAALDVAAAEVIWRHV